ncbi:MAG: apolipoprotein N-acyltransferase [Elusimicrobia bacterium]|nr:apolipoprotein N-acyltransferase [Elusimicrobiota bacterium]
MSRLHLPGAGPSPATTRGAAFLLSAASAGACYWPGGPGLPVWGAVAALLWLIEDDSPSRAFFRAWAWGGAAWGVAMYWFFPVTLQYAAGPKAWRLLLACAVIAYHALMVAVPTAAARLLAARLARRGYDPRAALALCAVPCFTASEGLFPQVYPACVATTQLAHLPAVQSLDLWGTGGLALLIFTVNAALYAAARLPRGGRWAAAAALACLLNEGYGLARMRAVDRQADAARAAGRVLSVAVLQGDLPLLARNTGDSAEPNIAYYRELSVRALAQAPADLVVWPHNSYERTLRFAADDPAFERPLLDGARFGPRLAADLPFAAHALVTAQAESPVTDAAALPSRHYASVLKGPGGSVLGTTIKVHPTPLAEWLPLERFLPALHRLTPRLKRVIPGPSRVLTMADGRRLGVFICYDAVRTAVARRLSLAGAQVLVNPSSDQWSYDKEVQPWQHLRIVMMRAVENRRSYVRGTPSGVSAVIDPVGRLSAALAVDAKGSLNATVALMEGRTPFMLVGDAVYGLALACAAALWALGRPRAT